MSGSTVSGSLQVTALSSLPLYEPPPAPTDQIFGIIGGVAQFVPQAQVWAGAVPTVGGAVSGPISWVGVPSSADHLTPKSYVDQQVASVTGAVSGSAAAAAGYANSASSYAAASYNGASTAINAQRGNPNGIAPLSGNGNLMLGGIEVWGSVSGHVILVADLPTSDPGIAGALWNNGNVVGISQG